MLKRSIGVLLIITLILGGCAGAGEVAFNNASQAYQEGKYYNAAFLYKKACNNGFIKGCFKLGLLYEKGIGVQQNYSNAVLFYQKACNKGLLDACVNLGLLYEEGKGTIQNFYKAASLFEKACNDGDNIGCMNLSSLCDQYPTACHKNK